MIRDYYAKITNNFILSVYVVKKYSFHSFLVNY